MLKPAQNKLSCFYFKRNISKIKICQSYRLFVRLFDTTIISITRVKASKKRKKDLGGRRKLEVRCKVFTSNYLFSTFFSLPYIKLKRNLRTTTRTIISTTTIIAVQSHPAKPPLLLRKNLICQIHPFINLKI